MIRRKHHTGDARAPFAIADSTPACPLKTILWYASAHTKVALQWEHARWRRQILLQCSPGTGELSEDLNSPD